MAKEVIEEEFLTPFIHTSFLKITKMPMVHLDVGHLKGNIGELPEYRQVFPRCLIGMSPIEIRQQTTLGVPLILAISTVRLRQALTLMDEVFDVIHQMQDCLEEDRARFIEEEEDHPMGEYSGEVLDFNGNNNF